MTIKQRVSVRRAAAVLAGCLALTVGGWAALRGQDKPPAGTQVVKIDVFPSRVELKTPFAYSQLILTGQLPSGERIDVTRSAKIEAAAQLLRVSPTGQVRP